MEQEREERGEGLNRLTLILFHLRFVQTHIEANGDRTIASTTSPADAEACSLSRTEMRNWNSIQKREMRRTTRETAAREGKELAKRVGLVSELARVPAQRLSFFLSLSLV